jgi:hypothetical protein
MEDINTIRDEVDDEIARLRRYAAASTSACTAAKVIALSDDRVRELVVERLGQRNVYRGAQCVGPGAVLVRFDHPPGRFGLVSPSFLVRVDGEQRVVTAVVDPYDPTELPVPRASQAPRARAGVAFRARSAPAAASEVRTVTVTVTGVSDAEFQIGAQRLDFDGAGRAEAEVTSGTHTCRWAVRGDPGDPFTITVEGAAKAVTLSSRIEDAEGEAGQFTITVA